MGNAEVCSGMNGSSAEMLARWRNGDEQAAGALFQRYTEKLLALVRSRLSGRLTNRFDPEDVVQSAYRSFLADAAAGHYVLKRSGDLWRLLAAITIHKTHRAVKYHTRKKRAVGREEQPGTGGLPAECVARTPSASEALAVVEELELVLRGLSPLHRRMVELRLRGHSLAEIAATTQRSERMVQLVLERVRGELHRRYTDYLNS